MVELALPPHMRNQVFRAMERNVNRNLSFQQKSSSDASSSNESAAKSRRTFSMHAGRHCEADNVAVSCPNSPSVKKAFRMIVVGSSRTGKTAILRRFLKNSFDDIYTPTIEDFHRKIYKIRGIFYQLDILDTSGNDPFPATRRLSLLTGDLFLIVCSLDNDQSCDEAFRLRDQILELKSENAACSSSDHNKSSRGGGCRVPIAIALNKTDLPPNKMAQIDRERNSGVQYCGFYECSAKTGEGINELFSALFALAKLPKELLPATTNGHQNGHLNVGMNPAGNSPVSDHRREGSAFKIAAKSSLVRLRSKRSEPAIDLSQIETQARRPSLRTDLLLLKAKSSNSSLQCYRFESGKKNRKCTIM